MEPTTSIKTLWVGKWGLREELGSTIRLSWNLRPACLAQLCPVGTSQPRGPLQAGSGVSGLALRKVSSRGHDVGRLEPWPSPMSVWVVSRCVPGLDIHTEVFCLLLTASVSTGLLGIA